MNGDGTAQHQISFNTNHDFAPSVLGNGQLVFSRWESTNGGQISLYRANPNGTGLELFYGANSHATGVNIAGTNNNVIQFLNARELANGTLVAIVPSSLSAQQGTRMVHIQPLAFYEIPQLTAPGHPAPTAPSSISSTTSAYTSPLPRDN